MNIEYDVPFEVTEKQYNALMYKGQFDGIICHKKQDGKYFIKVWLTKYAPFINQILESHK